MAAIVKLAAGSNVSAFCTASAEVSVALVSSNSVAGLMPVAFSSLGLSAKARSATGVSSVLMTMGAVGVSLSGLLGRAKLTASTAISTTTAKLPMVMGINLKEVNICIGQVNVLPSLSCTGFSAVSVAVFA